MRAKSISVILFIFPALIFFACGGDSGGGSSSGDSTSVPSPPSSTTTTGTVGSSGGSIQTSKGTMITIPEGVLAGDTAFTIRESSEALPLPSDFKSVSDTVEITGSDFIQAVTIRIPYSKTSVSNSDALVVAHYDSAKARWEMCTVVSKDLTNGFITAKTSHFSKFKVLEVAVDAITRYLSVYDPSTDVFPVFNKAEYFGGGACHGISAFTKWYFINKKNAYGPLRSFFDADEAVGVGLAAQNSVWNSHLELCYILSQQSYGFSQRATAYSLMAGLKLTNTPQILGLKFKGSSWQDGGHAILVYHWDQPYFYVYNPNYDPNIPLKGFEKIRFDGTSLYTDGYLYYAAEDGGSFDGFWHIGGVIGNNKEFENIFGLYSGADANDYSSFTGGWSGSYHETYGLSQGVGGSLTISLTVLDNGSLTGTGSSSSSLFRDLAISGSITSDIFAGSFRNAEGSLSGVFKATVKDADTLTGTYSYSYAGCACGGSIILRRN